MLCQFCVSPVRASGRWPLTTESDRHSLTSLRPRQTNRRTERQTDQQTDRDDNQWHRFDETLRSIKSQNRCLRAHLISATVSATISAAVSAVTAVRVPAVTVLRVTLFVVDLLLRCYDSVVWSLISDAMVGAGISELTEWEVAAAEAEGSEFSSWIWLRRQGQPIFSVSSAFSSRLQSTVDWERPELKRRPLWRWRVLWRAFCRSEQTFG